MVMPQADIAVGVPSGTVDALEWTNRLRRWLEVIADEDPERADSHVAERIGLDRSTVWKLRNKSIQGDFRMHTLSEMAEHMGVELPRLMWAVWRCQAIPPRVDRSELP